MDRFALHAGSALLLALAVGRAWAGPADGEPASAQVDFAIDAQPLASALIELGRQANVQVLTASDAVSSLHSRGARGELTVGAAMDRLLQGTDLDYQPFDGRTLVVKQRGRTLAPPPPSRAGVPAPEGPPVASLTPLQVQGVAAADGYVVDATRAATRTDTALADLPQSVGVLSHDLMDAQQANTIADVVSQVAGVQYVDGLNGSPLLRIRGFNAGNGMTDGMPNGVARIEDLPPLIGVERIEVLKGPEAILGDASVSNNFGGSLNIVMKKPQSDPVHELSYSVGQYDGARLGIDLAGPLGSADGLSYRLVAAGNRADHSAQGYRGQRSAYFAPSIGWRRGDSQLVASFEHVDNRVPYGDHTVLLGSSLASASPFGLLPGNTGDHASYRTDRASYAFDQGLADGWTFRSRGQYVQQHNSGEGWSLLDGSPYGRVAAIARAYRYSDAFYTLQNDLTASFGQGALVHTVVLGLDYAQTHTGSGGSSNQLVSTQPVSYDLFSLQELPSARAGLAQGASLQATSSPQTQALGGTWSTDTGLFLQDQIAIGERWNALLAIRRTTYDLAAQRGSGAARTPRRTQWVPKAGLVYRLAPEVALYANTVSGFQANPLLGQNGQPLPPALSRQVEAGARFDLLDRRARLSLAWYRITLDHSVDLVSPQPPYFATPGPGQTNHGLEVELAGELAPGLDVSASYTDARIRNDDGTPATAAPRRLFSAWASYRFQQAPLQAWSVGAGLVAQSRSLSRSSDGGAYFAVPGQASADVNITYHAPDWQLSLGVKNLFARTLYALDFDETFVPVREGRVTMLSGSYDF